MPAAPFSSPFARIALAFRERLANSLGVDQAFVRMVANDRYDETAMEPVFCDFQFFGPQPPRDGGLDFINPGAGRLMIPVARRMRVYVHTREGVDLYGGDEVALTGVADATDVDQDSFPGHFLAEEKILNSLCNWTILDGDERPLTLGPVHWADSSSGPPLRKPVNEEGLVRSALDFEVVYVLSVNQNDPPS
jgi:hypothetical protein